MTRWVRRAAAALPLLFATRPAAAQSAWRTLESSRQVRDSGQHHVVIRYGAGRIDVGATSAPVLYAMTLRYDESAATPLHRYDVADRTLVLGIESESHNVRRNLREQTKGELRVSLNSAVPMDLELGLGATKATLDLGGLSLTDLRLDSGASETQLDFTTPNASRMRALDVNVGAASFQARNLANANAGVLHLQGGVGSVDLDFGGQWTQDMDVDAQIALGKLTLHVPRHVGVRIEVQRFLASFEHDGLRKRGDAYYSDNWDTAKFRIRIKAQTAFGEIELDRGEY